MQKYKISQVQNCTSAKLHKYKTSQVQNKKTADNNKREQEAWEPIRICKTSKSINKSKQKKYQFLVVP